METLNTQLLVIGAGPGGYVCAIRAAQLGVRTVIVESDNPGGTCLNVGCIPSKALIHAADEFYKLVSYCDSEGTADQMGIRTQSASIDLAQTMVWKNSVVSRLNTGVSALLKRAGVNSIQGHARFLDGKRVVVNTAEGELRIQSDNVVIATGSEAIELQALPFTEHVLDSTAALSLVNVPESLAVVGGGYIGLELGTCFAKLGTQVTVIESADHILPLYDRQLTDVVSKRLDALGIAVLTNTTAQEYNAGTRRLHVEHAQRGRDELSVEKVLVTVGRKARLSGWGLSELSLDIKDGCVSIDDQCQSSMRGVYAIGDVTGEPMLAHRAMAQAELVAQRISGQQVSWDKQCIPAVCFTDPEIVSAGITPAQADELGLQVEVSTFPFQASGRAISIQRDDGFVRVVADSQSHALLGVQAVGVGVSELSAAFALAIEMGARAEDIAMTIHAHPTLSESFQEACMSILGNGLHV